jgi:hypothetical protein
LKGAKTRPGPGSSVQADWFGWLPPAKLQAFRSYSGEFESYYNMLSVSLDEAIGLRNCGRLAKSLQVVIITPALCECLTSHLEGMLASLEDYVRRSGLVPSVAPLDPADFQGEREQRSALKSSLLSRVLLTRRAQFLGKIATLREMVNYLGADYRHSVQAVISTAATDGHTLMWAAMDSEHFDLNTCLREAMVLLKCFLRVLPEAELPKFQRTVTSHSAPLMGGSAAMSEHKWSA